MGAWASKRLSKWRGLVTGVEIISSKNNEIFYIMTSVEGAITPGFETPVREDWNKQWIGSFE